MIFGTNPSPGTGVSRAALAGIAILLFSTAIAPYTAIEYRTSSSKSDGDQIFQNASNGQYYIVKDEWGLSTSYFIAGSESAPEAMDFARRLLSEHGYPTSEFVCLADLWYKESKWNYRAENLASGAYGIPQALPGNKMASVGKDWKTNPETQIRWGIAYIEGRYETPCAAWDQSESEGWY